MCMDYAAAPGLVPARNAVHRGGHALSRRSWRQPRAPSWPGMRHREEGVGDHGALTRLERRTRDRWRRRRSTARSTAGSRRWTREPASCSRKFKVGSGVVGNPITFRGPDGKQYVAVYAGIGGDWFLLSGDVTVQRSGGRAPAGRLRTRTSAGTPARAASSGSSGSGSDRRDEVAGDGCRGRSSRCPALPQGTRCGARRPTCSLQAEDRISVGGKLPAANALAARRSRNPTPSRREPVRRDEL